MIWLSLAWDGVPTFDEEAISQPLTVVVVFRNEETHLTQLFQSLDSQDVDQSNYEVLLIDDASEDKSQALAREWASKCRYKAEVIALGEFGLTGKKNGISKAVAQAKWEHILVTDADCSMPTAWLRVMSAGDADFVSGPVQYRKEKGLGQKLLALDFVSLIGLGAALIHRSRPILANGANMRFSKSRFNEVGGYSNSMDIPSGDDVFLLQSISNLPDTQIEFRKSNKAIVETQPPATFSGFIHQRIRWAGKTQFRGAMLASPALLLTVLYGFFFLIWILPVINPAYWDVVLMSFALKLVADYAYFNSLLRFMQQRKLLPYLVLIELLHPFYVVIIAVLSKVIPYQWKSRTIKHG
jgi:cellulose synthase/poly-beta-1,6-N-acetylglucosamine synthase-like glycosyltransferase